MSRPSADFSARIEQVSRRNADGDSELPERPRHVGVTAQSNRPRTPRTKTVRITTDLSPRSYRQLMAFCADLADQLGVARVTHSDIIRTLVSVLTTDSELQRNVEEKMRPSSHPSDSGTI